MFDTRHDEITTERPVELARDGDSRFQACVKNIKACVEERRAMTRFKGSMTWFKGFTSLSK